MLMITLLAGFIGCTKDDEQVPAPSKTTTATTNTGSTTTTTNTGSTTTSTNTGSTTTTTTNGGSTSTTGSSTNGTSTGSSTGTTTGTSTVNKAALLQLVNDARAKGCNCGSTYMQPVAPVTWNDKLEQAALIHSQDMNKNGYFSHTGSDGSSPASRVTSVGYQWSAIGENIAMGYPSEQAVMDAWLASEGHCKNIMNGVYTEMGTALDGKYWSQEFAKPMK